MKRQCLKALFALLVLVISVSAMEQSLFNDLLKRVKAQGFEDDQLTLFKTGMLNNTFTSDQVLKVLNTVHFGSGKLDMLRAVTKNMEDPENSTKILSSFDWADEMSAARTVLKQAKKAYPIKSAQVEVGYIEAYPADEFATLVSALKKKPFFDEKLVLLQHGFEDRSEGLNSEQVITLLRLFPISYDRVKALKVIEKNILGLTTHEVISILKTFNFDDDRLTTLKAVKDMITTGGNLFYILDLFRFSEDKVKAYEILKDIKPRSTIYGLVKENPVLFVVDVSGSMDAQFRASGVTFTRLEFVSSELQKVLTQQLTPNQKFNIMIFSTGVSLWKSDFVSGTPENIDDAVVHVKKLRANGGTNIYDALKKSFSFANVNGIYFLTDGVPTSGAKTSINAILTDVKKWNSGRNIPIHTTAFLMGSFSSDNKAQSRLLMKQLAEASKGVYRAIETLEDVKSGKAKSTTTTQKTAQKTTKQQSKSHSSQNQGSQNKHADFQEPDIDVDMHINTPDFDVDMHMDSEGMDFDMEIPEDPFQ